MLDELASVARASVTVLLRDGGQGSGTVVAHAGTNSYVLTCAHVVGEHKKVLITRKAGKKLVRYMGVVERVDTENDLALVRTAKRIPIEPIEIAKTDPALYERVYGVGTAGGLMGTGFEGVLTAKDGSGNYGENYAYTGLACSGMSGGALADEDGNLIGVIESMDRSGHLPVWCIGYAVPLPIIKTFLGKKSARKFATRDKK